MGACCQKLESVDHVDTIDDLKEVIRNDINLFKTQHKYISEDKVIKILKLHRVLKM
jgi:hypothetical protein